MLLAGVMWNRSQRILRSRTIVTTANQPTKIISENNDDLLIISPTLCLCSYEFSLRLL